MRILIIEDESLVAESLIKLVKQLEPSATILGPLSEVKQAIQWFADNPQPDLILSDIQLADGISLDIFAGNTLTCPIIFTTAYNEYAIRAFKVNSIDYLLKPVDKAELGAAFKKFHLMQSKFDDAGYLREIKDLFVNFNSPKPFKERFAVHIGRSVTLVPVQNIACFLKEELIFLIDHEGTRFITDYRSLDEVEELVNSKVFYRANRQNLIHLPFIESYRGDDTGKLTLKMRDIKTNDLIISKEKAADFKKWFDQ
ncbi:response regulator transcription factor [Mucilaginibacter terrigena]|uniref:Response regulator transcription factor n=1 Tax=Mucilaginibacter terrigena TaxID=2492395 RepID=A0A4Q5LR59_9SPHI|nr:LytTR family DNA-binding domain-containing protein [Mucilaginibacter terrigena]RYU91907.1 response regulator transcription factor [Mucilaginibacter terrigena]